MPQAMTTERQTNERHWPKLNVPIQFGLIFGAALTYFFVRGLTEGSISTADANAHRILDLENKLGINWESGLQDALVDNEFIVTISNWIYIWGHWPLIAITMIVLFRSRSPHYVLLRNAMFVSGAIGMVIYASFPVTPPRLLDLGFIDTVTENSNAYRILQPPALTNKYAAMPSLHAGWNLLAGWAIFSAANSRWLKAFGILSPLAMAFAVVSTANHYILDVVGGQTLAVVGLIGSHLIWKRFYATKDQELSVDEDTPDEDIDRTAADPRRIIEANSAPFVPTIPRADKELESV